MSDFRQQIIDRSVPAGRLTFWWLGQHSWIFKTAGTVIGFDLYLTDKPKRQVRPLLTPQQCDFLDLVLCTHDHTDHLDRPALPEIAKADDHATFVLPKVVAGEREQLGLPADRTVFLDGQSRFEQRGVKVVSVPSAHEFLDYDPTFGYPHLGYIVYVDGFCIYHSGDTCIYEGLVSTLKAHPLDIMLVPINGRDAERLRRGTIGNMTYQEAVDLIGAVGPKLACPAHFGMFKDNTVDPQLFADYLDVKFPRQKYVLPQVGRAVQFP